MEIAHDRGRQANSASLPVLCNVDGYLLTSDLAIGIPVDRTRVAAHRPPFARLQMPIAAGIVFVHQVFRIALNVDGNGRNGRRISRSGPVA